MSEFTDEEVEEGAAKVEVDDKIAVVVREDPLSFVGSFVDAALVQVWL